MSVGQIYSSENETVIKPSRGWSALNLGELWRYRELLYFLTWRDIKVKYKQTLLGSAWAILQPLFTMVVFTIFFGKMAQIPSDGAPYPIFSYAGLLPWTYFATAVSFSSNSLVGSAHLVTKVYFPRLLVPTSATLAGLVDYVIALSVLVIMMGVYRFAPGIEIVLVPLLLMLCFFTATGVGLWLSALNVKYRDIRYVVPFLLQFWLFVTPVIYPISFLPEQYRWLMALNPMAGVIEAHRVAVLGHKAIDWFSLGISSSVLIILLVTGAFYFRRMERSFADVI
jgi:lipopolysaccharide transport system permease protein